MADKKISALTAATTPLAGTEVLPIVQSGATVKVPVSDLTTGRAVSALSFSAPTIGAGSGSNLSLQADGATKATLDTNANYGLNVVPSAWRTTSSTNAMQISTVAALSGSSSSTQLSNNIFLGTSGWQTLTTGLSGLYSQYSGVHEWYTAASTSAGGFPSLTTALTLDASSNLTLPAGNVIIGTSGKGIDFSATPGTGTSELLADYEEGTFTPVFTSLTVVNGTGGATYSGRYTKIGRIVNFEVVIAVTGTCTTASTVSATRFTTPFTIAQDSTAGFVFLRSAPIGEGTCDSATNFVWCPAWVATNTNVIISGFYEA
jgi:hypothetical protein